MSNHWLERPSTPKAWRAPQGLSREERSAEQDAAAGGHAGRLVPAGDKSVPASVALRKPQPGRRIYAYLRWSVGGRTHERYVGEVSGKDRAEYLRNGWRQVFSRALLPKTPDEAVAPSWASRPAVRAVMRANPRKDTRPERELRSYLHCRGMRYRVDVPPLPSLRQRADIVFPRAKVAVFVDGCFWHGCPQHYRPSNHNAGFWQAKRAENQARDRRIEEALAAAGWVCVRVWEHEDMADAADRVFAEVAIRRRRIDSALKSRSAIG